MIGAPERILRVHELTVLIARRLMEGDDFKDLWIEGEVSDTRIVEGNIYFTLRDNTSEIRCSLFATAAASVAITPRLGARLLAHGELSVYIKRGTYSLRCDDVRPAGAGDSYLRLEALKKRLAAEGLFAQERKRPLPARPRRVGVVTSAAGAAWRDVQTVIARRDAKVEIVFAAAQVQGQGAVESMIGALDGLAQLKDLDVAILARGGGATEDLSPFNDEALVRAIARFPRPLCTGVGHETDVTLVDLVADLRAPTPSGAAELVVPDASADAVAAARLRRRIEARVRDIAADRRRRLVGARRLLDRRAPAAHVAELRLRLDDARRTMDRAVVRAVPQSRQRALSARRRLDALSPLAVLRRGYAIVESADGSIRADAARLRAGEDIMLRMRDGRAGATVREVRLA